MTKHKLHVGCGTNILPEFVNLDMMPLPGVDLVHNLETDKFDLSLHDTFTGILMEHTLEHIKNPLFCMEQLYRVATPNCKLIVKVPYGSTDDAWEDPTHVRPYFIGSWVYFSQLIYTRTDYGYRGDWEVEDIMLDIYTDKCDSNEGERILEEVKTKRNIVKEMTCTLRAVKPLRRITAPQEIKNRITFNFI